MFKCRAWLGDEKSHSRRPELYFTSMPILLPKLQNQMM